MRDHTHVWQTMTTGRGFIRWQRCVAAAPACTHPWWERLGDWILGVTHAGRSHPIDICDAQRMIKGAPW